MSVESAIAKHRGVRVDEALLRDETINFLKEELDNVKRMMDYDERGWTPLGADARKNVGISLKTAKESAAKIRELAVGSPLIKRGLELRFSYIWSKGVIVPGIDDDPGNRAAPEAGKTPAKQPAKRGRPTAAQQKAKQDAATSAALDEFWRRPLTQRAVAAPEAQQQMEFAAGTDGCYLLLGVNSTKDLRSIPLSEITGFMTNPDFTDEIWAYRRSWKPDPNGTAEKTVWVYVDTYTGDRSTSITADNETHPVEADWTIIDQWVNKQTGWPLGIADALPAVPWARMYVELMQNGREMTDALARLVAKVKTVSPNAAKNVGVKFSGGGAGQVATYGEGQDVDVFQAAGKTYDFDGIRPVAAQVAAALEVSIVHLLADPGAAGSSYGSAANLDTPTKRAMVARQNIWASFLERVILWGTGQKLNVSFPALDDPDPYREIQARVLGWNTGLVYEDEMRPELLKALSIQSRHDTPPEGVMLPNNMEAQTELTKATTPAPDQGQQNGTGGQGSKASNDRRSSSTKEMLDVMQQQDFLMGLRELVERLEKATG